MPKTINFEGKPAEDGTTSTDKAGLVFDLTITDTESPTQKYTSIREADLPKLLDAHVAQQLVKKTQDGLASGQTVVTSSLIAEVLNTIIATELNEHNNPTQFPGDVAQLFVLKDGQYYFRNDRERPAFEDKGDELRTSMNSNVVAESFVKIAKARGWTEITVEGSEEFKKQVWTHAQKAGILANGYAPTDKELDAVARLNPPKPEPIVPVQAATTQVANTPAPTQAPAQTAPSAESSRQPLVKGAVQGLLMEHAQAPYMFQQGASRSYYAKIKAETGAVIVKWGVDVERAVNESGALIGDTITLTPGAKTRVTQRIPVLDPQTGQAILGLDGKPANWQDKEVSRQTYTVAIVQRGVQLRPQAPATDANTAKSEPQLVMWRPGAKPTRFTERVSGILLENVPATFLNRPDGHPTRMLKLKLDAGDDVMIFGADLHMAVADARAAFKDYVVVTPIENPQPDAPPVRMSVLKETTRKLAAPERHNITQLANAQNASSILEVALSETKAPALAQQKVLNAAQAVLTEKLQIGEFIPPIPLQTKPTKPQTHRNNPQKAMTL